MVGGGGLDVIRARCWDCCGEQEAEVRKCVSVACVNWPYRMVANPFRKQNVSDEDRERRRARGRTLAARRHAAVPADVTSISENPAGDQAAGMMAETE